MRPERVLFVCLGNICRSPAAHAVFDHLAHLAGRAEEFITDSCGTGDWHTGDLADPRMRAVAKSHGVEMTHRARTFAASDFENFDVIFVMDRSNRAEVLRRARTEADRAKVQLFRPWDPERGGDEEVPDPYYGGEADFQEVWNMVHRAAAAYLATGPAQKSVP